MCIANDQLTVSFAHACMYSTYPCMSTNSMEATRPTVQYTAAGRPLPLCAVFLLLVILAATGAAAAAAAAAADAQPKDQPQHHKQ
jgi:hypothetical protein